MRTGVENENSRHNKRENLHNLCSQKRDVEKLSEHCTYKFTHKKTRKKLCNKLSISNQQCRLSNTALFFNDISAPPSTWTQRVELLGQSHLIRENSQVAQISIDVPSVQAEEMSVQLSGKRIIVSGHYKQAGHSEKFERYFAVDGAIDISQITANLFDGVLVLTIQRQRNQISRMIPIVQEPPDQLL